MIWFPIIWFRTKISDFFSFFHTILFNNHEYRHHPFNFLFFHSIFFLFSFDCKSYICFKQNLCHIDGLQFTDINEFDGYKWFTCCYCASFLSKPSWLSLFDFKWKEKNMRMNICEKIIFIFLDCECIEDPLIQRTI